MKIKFAVLALLCALISACVSPPIALQKEISNNPAVNNLLAEANSYSEVQAYQKAGASLERALRIEPRNAALWLQLAKIKSSMGDTDAAANIALRAKSLTTAENLTQQIENFLAELYDS